MHSEPMSDEVERVTRQRDEAFELLRGLNRCPRYSDEKGASLVPRSDDFAAAPPDWWARRGDLLGVEGEGIFVKDQATYYRVQAKLLRDAAIELLEAAGLRESDSGLPHPSDDQGMCTARMQDAWNELRAVLEDMEANNAE